MSVSTLTLPLNFYPVLIFIVNIFQRFIIILTDHLVQCEAEGRDYNTPWYKWVIERLHQVFLIVSLIKSKLLMNHPVAKVTFPIIYTYLYFSLLVASRTGVQIYQYFGKSSVHK